MAKVSTAIRDDRDNAIRQYYNYASQYYATESRMWAENHMDHLRLPANVDVTEFLIYLKFRFYAWLEEIGYTGEQPEFAPAFSDTILSDSGTDVGTSGDSPHLKIPWSIAYRVKRKTPMSLDPPFGRRRTWKFRYMGYFRNPAPDNGIYEIRMKEWESLVEFVVMARSNLQVDVLTRTFEDFMMTNQGYFQSAGLCRVIPLGRIDEKEQKLDDAGIHYRKSQFWMHTEEFFVAGPFTEIRNISLESEVTEFPGAT